MLFSGCTDPQEQTKDTTQTNDDTNEETDTNSTTNVSVLATVNGIEITSDEVTIQQQYYAQQGQQISEEDALEQIIDQEILYLQSQQEGYALNNTEAEAELADNLQQQNQTLEGFKEYLQEQQLSYQEQLQNYKEQSSIQKYLEVVLEDQNFTVTDQEAESYYASYAQQSTQEVPPYEDIKSQIIDYLKQQKQQEAINDLIEELREDADIQYR